MRPRSQKAPGRDQTVRISVVGMPLVPTSIAGHFFSYPKLRKLWHRRRKIVNSSFLVASGSEARGLFSS